jgi:hypothetical protein
VSNKSFTVRNELEDHMREIEVLDEDMQLLRNKLEGDKTILEKELVTM